LNIKSNYLKRYLLHVTYFSTNTIYPFTQRGITIRAACAAPHLKAMSATEMGRGTTQSAASPLFSHTHGEPQKSIFL